MSEHIVAEVVKNDTDEEPEEGEIQDDEELEDVSSDEEITSVTKKEETFMYPRPFVSHKSKITRQRIVCGSRSEMRFHLPVKPDHVCQSIQKRPRSGIRSGGHDLYYDMPPRYKTFKDLFPKERIHEKENKARETKKLYKKSSLYSPTLESRSGYISSADRGDGRFSSTSSKGTWHKSELKEKHKKKKKSKNSKSYPLVEVHESQVIQSKDTNVTDECIKTTMNVEENVCEKDTEIKQDPPVNKDLTSPATSDVVILDVPLRIPEIITIGDSDDDEQLQKLNKDISELNVAINPNGETCDNKDKPCESVEVADVCEDADLADMDENLDFLREAALNSSKSDQSSNMNPDEEVLQLRLAALRSAIIRKCEERKKRGITLAKRGKNAEEKHVMSISPLSSPNHCSSGDSFNRTCEVEDSYFSSGEFNGSCDPPDLGSNSEVDKITAVDMELVESDEEKEQISNHSGEASSNEVVRITDGFSHMQDEAVEKNSNDSKVPCSFSEDMPTPVTLQSVSASASASQSPMTPQVENSDVISGYIIGDYDNSADSQDPVMPSLPTYFNSPLVSSDQTTEMNELSASQQPDLKSCALKHNVSAGFELNVGEELNNQSESSMTTVETCESGPILAGNDPNMSFLTGETEDSNDSCCSSRDLDLESMIVLDEVGKCSDDSKSDSSAVDVSTGIDFLCHSKSNGICDTLEKCEVNSHDMCVESANSYMHTSVGIKGSKESEKESVRETMIDNDVMKSTSPEDFQCPVRPSNSVLDCVSKDHFLENNLDIGYDERQSNHISPGKIETVGNSISKISNNLSLSGEFNNKEIRVDEDVSDLNVVISDLSCDLSHSPGPLLNLDCQKPVATHLSDKDGNFKCSREDSVQFEFSSDSGDPNRLTTESPAEGKNFTGSDSDCANEKSVPCGIKSCSELGITGVHAEGSHVCEKLQSSNEGNNSPNLTSICAEEDEDVLRLRALAMLNKKPGDKMPLRSSPQNFLQKKHINTNDSCDLGSAENSTIRQELNTGSFPHSSNFSSLKNIKITAPIKQTLPSKSSSVNQTNYAHHISLPPSKLAYPSRNKLTSVNKRGSKTSESRILKNSSSARSNINVPEFVINLGEDSDSGDDSVHDVTAVGNETNVSKKTIDNQSGVQVVPPDFEKKLDLLLKQARFEQEIITNEEKGDKNDNVPLQSVKSSILLSKVPSEGASESLTLENLVNSSTVHGSALDATSESTLKVAASVAVDLGNFAVNGNNTVSFKENVSSYRVNSNKLASSTSVCKAAIAQGKKSVRSVSSQSPPAMSIADIGLLPSNKQKEYIRLKTQLAQLVRRDDVKTKGSFELKNLLESKHKNVDTILQTSLRRNVVKNNIGANIDRSLISRKLIRRVQVGSQVARNDLAKARRLVKTVPNVNNSTTPVPDILSTNYLNKNISPRGVFPVSKIPAQERKVVSANLCVRKGAASTQITITDKPRTSAQVSVVRLSTAKSTETGELSPDKCVAKYFRNRTQVDKVSVAQDNAQGVKCSSLKRKKSISESCGVSLRKKCPAKLQTSSVLTCSIQSNSSSEGDTCLAEGDFEVESTADKKLAEELWTTENKLMAKRYQVLEDIAAVRLNLHEIEKVNVMKQQILTDIKILKEKMSLAESQLSLKEELLTSLYTEVEDAKRNIMRRQSETLLLSVECEEKGCKVHGSNYSVPNMCTDMIRNGMLSISKTLQNLKEGNVSVESFSGLPPICSSGDQGLKEDTGMLPISDLIDDNNDELNKQLQHSYSSPLDAMRTESGSDSHAVLCPYHIMGSCKDKECSYLH